MLGNWILQTTTTTGTGALTLAGVTGFPAASTQFVTDQLFSYTILDDATGAPIERGLGYLDGSGNLVRARPGATMSGGTYDGSAPTAVSLPAGTKRVVCAAGANSHDTLPGLTAVGGVAGYGDLLPQAGGTFTSAVTPDQVYLIPFKHCVDQDIVSFKFRMPGTSGAGGTTAKIAAYSIGLDGGPGAKLAESAAVSVASNGIKTCSVTPFRPSGRYFVAFLTDGAPVVSMQGGSINGDLGLGMSGTFTPIAFLTHAGATGVVFPTTWTLAGQLFSVSRPTILACTA